MENFSCGQATLMLKKGKKKQDNGELDRQKLAEKKRRRLEKALATSAAIRSELEKKKQRKKEEERLDVESAAISEAVAPHVLVGEDTEESHRYMLKNRCGNVALFSCGQATLMLTKGKKKQDNGELDGQKLAEKKRRRLEKALATSAAIRSELEKKKQRKKEEEERLDAESAAIPEAVALHVLVGEDTEESHRYMLKNSCGNVALSMDYYQNFAKYQPSTSLTAAQAVASLQIAEDSSLEQQHSSSAI